MDSNAVQLYIHSTVLSYAEYIPSVQRSPVQPVVQLHDPGKIHVPPFAQCGLHTAAEKHGRKNVLRKTQECSRGNTCTTICTMWVTYSCEKV